MKHERHAVTTAFLINGLRDYKPTPEQVQALSPDYPESLSVVLATWGNGCVELFDQLANISGLVAAVADRCYAAMAEHGEGFPGVFEYEVTEALGTDIAEHLVAPDDAADRSWDYVVQQRLYDRASKFFRQCSDNDVLKAIDAIFDELLPLADRKAMATVEPAPPTLPSVSFRYPLGALVFRRHGYGVEFGTVIAREFACSVLQKQSDAFEVQQVARYEIKLRSGATAVGYENTLFSSADAAVRAIIESNNP